MVQVQVLILHHIYIYMYLYLYLCLRKSTCTSPEPGPKTYSNFLHHMFFVPFQTRNYYQKRMHKNFQVRPTKIETHLHPLFLIITLRKRYLLKLLIFYKVLSEVFGVVDAESINNFSKFWKKFLAPEKP